MSKAPSPSTPDASTIQEQPERIAAFPVSIFITAAAAALVGAFFLPWITIGDLLTTTGYKFALGPSSSAEARMFLAVPLVALIAVVAGLINKKQQRGAARIAGLLPIIAFFYVVIRYGQDATQLFGVGAWMSVGVGVLLFVLGCLRQK
jgi:hypothetical protein